MAKNSLAGGDTLLKVAERKFRMHNDSIYIPPSEGLFDEQLRPYNTTLNQEADYYPWEELALQGLLLITLSRVILPNGERSKPRISYPKKRFGFFELSWDQEITFNEDNKWVYDFGHSTQQHFAESVHPVRKKLLIAGIVTSRPIL
jgi:hypothetical protein